jgi:hypothetical protein
MQRFAPSEPFSPQKHRNTVKNAIVKNQMGNQRSKAKDSSVSLCLCGDDLVTALRIFRPPVDIAVAIQDGKLAHITCPRTKAMQGEILWAAGPWRSSGDWWEKEGWARDEWDIAVQGESDIALYRLVRDRLGGRWFLEGTYD